ncbi:transmembrane protein 184 homolog [[Candida] railenensis]|uniref:Transmembrane protein 184 homolog n=1 Tax=[Candida] railenensis TaxID=45579 RepID=A0A9P0QMN1_9ASCO|nr:transmembrane protein 184 homolog [[Candida] railenensis]
MNLPSWVYVVSGYSSVISSLIIFTCINLHFLNYRKPFEQRLMVRIQLIVPMFALSCYCMLVNPHSIFNKYILEPIREIYEAFVIYTFFSLLTQMLGGERSIIIRTSGREPVSHPGLLRYILPAMDISEPTTFLNIKRGILQYVWLKPIICFSILFTEALGYYNGDDLGWTSLNLWLTLLYNMSVSLSLYCLAIFWKILWTDLKPFNPVGKFLCVKLIIFASYWQGVILMIVNFMGWLPPVSPGDGKSRDDNGQGAADLGPGIQNALLCVELILFSIGHWYSFSYKPFTISHIPNGRLQFIYAVKDTFGINDLIHDFQLTFYGDYYKDYQQFDSVEALISHPESRGRMSRINQGLRYHSDGTQKHWLPSNQPNSNNVYVGVNGVGNSSTNKHKIQSTSENQALPSENNNSINNSAPSVRSMATTGTSIRGMYSPSIPPSISPSTGSPSLLPQQSSTLSMTEILNHDSSVMYDDEYLDEDELYYSQATSVINNYNLDQIEVKRLLNYPIVDEVIVGHEFGHKVKKLRAERERLVSARNYGTVDDDV